MTLRRLTLLAFAVLAAGVVLHSFGKTPPRGFWPGGVRRFEGEGRPGYERGLWSYWYRNGQLRERGHYSLFHRVGVWRQWHANGQRASVGERVWSEEAHASLRHGPWATWHENGDLRSQGSYQYGKRVGEWKYWRIEGERTVLDTERSGRYEDDQKVD